MAHIYFFPYEIISGVPCLAFVPKLHQPIAMNKLSKNIFWLVLICVQCLSASGQKIDIQTFLFDSLRQMLIHFHENTWNKSVWETLKTANDNVKQALKTSQLDLKDSLRKDSMEGWKGYIDGFKAIGTVKEKGSLRIEYRYANGSYSSDEWRANGDYITTYFSLYGDYYISVDSDSSFSGMLGLPNGEIQYYYYFSNNKGYSGYFSEIHTYEDTVRYEYQKRKTIGLQTWSYLESRNMDGIISSVAHFGDVKKANCWKDLEQNGLLLYRIEESIDNDERLHKD